MKTADLYDDYGDLLQVVAPAFASYGARRAFSGQITTLKLFEDNTMVRETLSQPGDGRVLIVDGGGSLRCALLGDQLAQLAVETRQKMKQVASQAMGEYIDYFTEPIWERGEEESEEE